MEVTPENIIVNSCEYTPVYLIPAPSVPQTGSYIIAQNNQDGQKPVTDNLKRFYENSGNLEKCLLSPKPRILKKQNSGVVGNKLKLASFLLPKNEEAAPTLPTQNYQIPNEQYTIPIKNVILEPVNPVTTNVVTTTTVPSLVSGMPSLEIDRKIVRVGTIPSKYRTPPVRITARVKPKENATANSSKHTSVQLLKLGETYHSLNQLSDEQMKIVDKALKIFSDPEKTPKEPAYDPVTNTKFIYKIVSPRDLTVVGGNKVLMKQKKAEIKKFPVKKVEKKDVKQLYLDNEFFEEVPEPKVTRSGRTVKLPKVMRTVESPQKPKKKAGSLVSCYQCSMEFSSLYRLQRHYEAYPTHVPAKIHSNLFHCLLAIIKGGSREEQPNILVRQLEQLVDKLRALLPCLLRRIDGGKLCTINDDVGRLFGMNPGKYNINIDALTCVKEKDGHCVHNPPPKNQVSPDASKPSQPRLCKHSEEAANEAETEDCARINSVDKWPTVSKRIWKIKQQKTQKSNAKKIRLASESEPLIELGIDEIATFCPSHETAIAPQDNPPLIDNNESEDTNIQPATEPTSTDQSNKPKAHIQFHSTHFDIRSSPIKTSTLMRKFQLNPQKISNFEVQLMRPLSLDKADEQHNLTKTNSDTSIQLEQIFNDSEIPKDVMNNEINFDNPKEWTMSVSNDSYMKTNTLFDSITQAKLDETLLDTSLMHMPDKSSNLFETPTPGSLIDPMMHSKVDIEPLLQDNTNLFDPSATHVKTKLSNIIDSAIIHARDKNNDVFDTNLAHKDTVDCLFDTTLAKAKDKTSSLIESSLMLRDENNSFYDAGLSHVKERSRSLFETKSTGLFEPSMIYVKEKSNGFDPISMHMEDKRNGSTESKSAHIKSSGLFETSMIDIKDKPNGLFEPIRIHVKDERNGSIEQCHIMDSKLLNMCEIKGDLCTNENDSRLSSSQGASVLNFLESLGQDCLSFPETEIRNNSVDFQLDLFSFNSS